MNFLPYLAWNSKNKQKFAKMRKRNIQLDVFSPKSNSKLIFRIFVNFQLILNKKWQKTCFLCFSQKQWVLVKIWHYQCVPCEIPFLKMYTCMHFYEFVKKLCYKIKMPKRVVLSPLKARQMQCRSQPHSPGWARVPLSSFSPKFWTFFSYFSSNFSHFLPHFGSPGGRLAHPGRPWLRHWTNGSVSNVFSLVWFLIKQH